MNEIIESWVKSYPCMRMIHGFHGSTQCCCITVVTVVAACVGWLVCCFFGGVGGGVMVVLCGCRCYPTSGVKN